MNMFALIAVAIGLSMDAFSVSIAKGISLKEVKVTHALKVAAFFGGFQALMPLIGWVIGESFSSYIENFAHYIAFVLLFLLGGKMIYEGLNGEDEEDEKDSDPLRIRTLVVLAIATSIDALLVGFTIALFDIPILLAVSMIGLITFVICFCGVWLGSKIGEYLNRYAEMMGGIILIGIGILMLIEGM